MLRDCGFFAKKEIDVYIVILQKKVVWGEIFERGSQRGVAVNEKSGNENCIEWNVMLPTPTYVTFSARSDPYKLSVRPPVRCDNKPPYASCPIFQSKLGMQNGRTVGGSIA